MNNSDLYPIHLMSWIQVVMCMLKDKGHLPPRKNITILGLAIMFSFMTWSTHVIIITKTYNIHFLIAFLLVIKETGKYDTDLFIKIFSTLLSTLFVSSITYGIHIIWF